MRPSGNGFIDVREEADEAERQRVEMATRAAQREVEMAQRAVEHQRRIEHQAARDDAGRAMLPPHLR